MGDTLSAGGEVLSDQSKKICYTVDERGDSEETPGSREDPRDLGDCLAWFGEGNAKLWNVDNDRGGSGELLGEDGT